MIASLMMYARPELGAAHASLWSLIHTSLADHGIPAPDSLSQSAPEFATWTDPALVLSQTCGMPYRLWLHNRTGYVGTPDYGLPNCPLGYYQSAIVTRADDPRDTLADYATATFAYNVPHSQSGYAAPWAHTKPLGFWFQNRLQTGAHSASAAAVASGQADIAALDAVTWRLLQRYDKRAETLRVLDWTTPTPGLPLITAKSRDTATIHTATAQAITALDPNHRTALGLRGLTKLDPHSYHSVPNPTDQDYSQQPTP